MRDNSDIYFFKVQKDNEGVEPFKIRRTKKRQVPRRFNAGEKLTAHSTRDNSVPEKYKFVVTEENGKEWLWHSSDEPESDFDAWYNAGKTGYEDFPSRETGYWYFIGWTDVEVVDEYTIYHAGFNPGILEIPIDWNSADNASSPKMQCTWGERYPNIVPIPHLEGNTFIGAILSAVDDNSTIYTTHDEDGNGVTNVGYIRIIEIDDSSPSDDDSSPSDDDDYNENIGKGTKPFVEASGSPEPFELSKCKIVIAWKTPIIRYDVYFQFTESNGTRRTWEYQDNSNTVVCRKQFRGGTPIEDIKNDADIKKWLSAGKLDSTLQDVFPQRSSGYWYFTGWQGEFPSAQGAELVNDIVFTALFSEAKVKFTVIDDIREDSDDSSDAMISDDILQDDLECTWENLFSPLGIISDYDQMGAQEVLLGASLVTVEDGNVKDIVIPQTHNSLGEGIAYVYFTSALGHQTQSTVDGRTATVVAIDSCYIMVLRGKIGDVPKTLEDLRNKIYNIPSPFADADFTKSEFPKNSTTEVNFRTGFPGTYTIPLVDPNTGKVNRDARVISRKDINTIGYIGTQEQFFEQCGGYHTFDTVVCSSIGGYPHGAILRFYQPENKCLRTVYSLVNNNTWNFITNGVDGVHWKYIDDNHVLSMRLDYSKYEDLGETLFCDSGICDWYTVPYNSYLQMFSLSCVDMHSVHRNIDEEYWRVSTSVEETKDQFGREKWVATEPETFDGSQITTLTGVTYLDVYNKDTNTTKSIRLRGDGSRMCVSVLKREGVYNNLNQDKPIACFYAYKVPRLVTAQGGFFLTKGDDIRVRGYYTDICSVPNNPEWGEVTTVSHGLTDEDVSRIYCVKFANLYKVRWEL